MGMRSHRLALLLLASVACRAPVPSPAGVEAVSLLGDTLRTPMLDSVAQAGAIAKLDSARTLYQADTNSADALIWLGRRNVRYRHHEVATSISGLLATAASCW